MVKSTCRHLFYYGMGTSMGYIAGLQPYKVVYYNRMTLVVLQILTPHFTNFLLRILKIFYSTPRFTTCPGEMTDFACEMPGMFCCLITRSQLLANRSNGLLLGFSNIFVFLVFHVAFLELFSHWIVCSDKFYSGELHLNFLASP